MSSMKNVKVAEALGSLASRRLISVETKTPLKEVLHTMHTNRILSVPIFDVDKGCVGLADVLDLVQFTAVQYFSSQEASVMDDNVMMAPELFRQFEFEDKTAGDLLKQSKRAREFKVVDQNISLGELAKVLSHDSHRVLIGQSKDAKLVSQSDLVRYLSERKDQLDARLLNTPLSELNIIHEQILHVSEKTSTIKAFCHLVRSQVHALAVLDQQQRLVGTLSASDLRGISDENLNRLTQPVKQFLQLTDRKAPDTLIRCSPNEKLDLAINKLVEAKVHRLWVTDENEKPIGVLALTDIIRTLLA
jgi:5'-AMP-activated protein kinase regulatory gamma subunit